MICMNSLKKETSPGKQMWRILSTHRKAVAKVSIGRSKENADALMNSMTTSWKRFRC